jgi:hypothetical protein
MSGAANVRVLLEIEDGIIEQQKRKRGCNQSPIRIYCTRGLRIHRKIISRKTSARHSEGQREVKDQIVKDLHFITKIWCLDRKLTIRQKGLFDLKEAEKGIPSLVARPSNICKTFIQATFQRPTAPNFPRIARAVNFQSSLGF